MKMWRLVLCIFFAQTIYILNADTIKIYNQSSQDLYVAIYYLHPTLPAQQATLPTVVKALGSLDLERPARKTVTIIPLVFYDRQLVFDLSPLKLQPSIGVEEFKKMPQINIGTFKGSSFYLTGEGLNLQGFNFGQWNIQKPFFDAWDLGQRKIQSLLSVPIKEQIKAEVKAVRENPYKDTVAKIRVGNQLHPDEKEYLAKRKPKAKAALEKFLGHPIDNRGMPIIALVESGGGYRAMTCSVGWHVGAEKIGLMDSVSYMVGLSGSTWSIGLWTLSGQPIESFKQSLMRKMNISLASASSNELNMILANFLAKSLFSQELTMIDFYGGLLANVLLQDFAEDRQRIYLSSQAQKIASADLPFPIYTAVRGDLKTKQDWYEFTPYEVGASWLGMYVPTWAYGREFYDGASIDFAPEQSWGYLMGTFGSAFSASAERIFSEVKKRFPRPASLAQLVEAILNEIETQHIAPIATQRITAAVVYNFTFGIKDSLIKDKTTLKLVDAGLEFNLPYPPISGQRPERKADIIIFLDASDLNIGNEMKKVESYARANNLKFPHIDYSQLAKHTITIFKDENDPAVPLVIYMPRINDPQLLTLSKDNNELASFIPLLTGFDVDACIAKDYCSTINFTYNAQQMQQLNGLTEFNMRANKNILKTAIEWKVKQMDLKK